MQPNAVKDDPAISDADVTLIVGPFRTTCRLQRAADLMALDYERKQKAFLRVDASKMLNWPVNIDREDVTELANIDIYLNTIICHLIVSGDVFWIYNLLLERFRGRPRIIPYCHWEMPRFPEAWRAIAVLSSEIWFPTPFVKSSFELTFPDFSSKSRIVM